MLSDRGKGCFLAVVVGVGGWLLAIGFVLAAVKLAQRYGGF